MEGTYQINGREVSRAELMADPKLTRDATVIMNFTSYKCQKSNFHND